MKFKNFFTGLVSLLIVSVTFAFALSTPIAETFAVVFALGIIVDIFLPRSKSHALFMKILWGAGVVDGRGKLNGWVASKNRFGAYFRTKVTPVNPQTQPQQNRRGILAVLSQAWRGLTESQRAGWASLAEQIPFTDIFGNSKTLSGNSMYVKLNANLATVGEAANADAPVPVGITQITSLDLAADASAHSMTVTCITPAGLSLSETFVIEFTPQVSQGKYFVKSLFRQFDSVNDLDPGVDFGTNYESTFGTITEGLKVFVRVFVMNTDTGQTGIAFEASAIVAA